LTLLFGNQEGHLACKSTAITVLLAQHDGIKLPPINQSISQSIKGTNSYFKDHRGKEQLKGKTGVGTTE